MSFKAFIVDSTMRRTELDVVHASEYDALRSRLSDLEAERALIVQRAENAEAALETCDLLRVEAMNACTEADERHSRYVKAVGELAGMAARLAEADALLREIHDRPRHCREGAYDVRMYVGDYERIDAYLSRKEHP